MTKLLTGLNSLAYQGVNAPTPPNSVQVNRAPTVQDYSSFNIGDNWVNTATNDVWILVDKAARVATWLRFVGAPGGVFTITGNTGGAVPPNAFGNINIVGDNVGIVIAGTPGSNTLTASLVGAVAESYPTDFTSPAVPVGGVLNVFGGTSLNAELVPLVFRKNMHTAAVANTVFVKLNESLSFPATNAAGTEGVIYSNGVAAGNRFLHNFGLNSTFLGVGSGNFTLTGTDNIGFGAMAAATLVNGSNNAAIGTGSLSNITDGNSNTGCGDGTLLELTTGNENTALGASSSPSLTTGSNNTTIGFNSLANAVTSINNIVIGSIPVGGDSYTTNESNNILIGSAGIIGESNTIRIGTTGVGAFQQIQTFVAGLVTVDLGLTATVGNVETLDGNLQATVPAVSSVGPVLNLKKSRAGGAVIAGDNCGIISFIGNDGTGLVAAAQIGCTVGTGTVAAGRIPGVLRFNTHPDAATGAVPSLRMLLNEEGNLTFFAPDSGTSMISVTTYNFAVGGTNRAVLVDNAGNIGTAASSIEFKENIYDMADSSSSIMNLRPVVFNFKKDSNKTIQFGLIAEEVEKTMPELVSYNDDNNPHSVRYHDLPSLLLNELQKLNARVKVLEKMLFEK